MRGRRLVALLLVLVFGGCAPARGPRAATGDTHRPEYREGMEYVVTSVEGVMLRSEAAKGRTYYFQTDRRQTCYSFDLPGIWEAGRETAVLRRVDGRSIVGVLVFDISDLGGGSPDDAIRQAAERSGRLYATAAGPVPWTLTPHPRMPGAWVWRATGTVEVPDRPGAVATVIPRWYVPIEQRWIAQLSVRVPDDVDRERFVDDLIRSLRTTRERRCYEGLLRTLGGVR